MKRCKGASVKTHGKEPVLIENAVGWEVKNGVLHVLTPEEERVFFVVDEARLGNVETQPNVLDGHPRYLPEDMETFDEGLAKILIDAIDSGEPINLISQKARNTVRTALRNWEGERSRTLVGLLTGIGPGVSLEDGDFTLVKEALTMKLQEKSDA